MFVMVCTASFWHISLLNGLLYASGLTPAKFLAYENWALMVYAGGNSSPNIPKWQKWTDRLFFEGTGIDRYSL